MRVLVNEEHRDLPEASTVADLVLALGLTGVRCAVEVNRRLIPRAEHAGHRLEEGDRVEVVTLVGGG